MQIAYHLGVHGTDDDRLLRCLLRNRGALARAGVAVPGPQRYRLLMRDAAAQLRGEPASTQTQAMLLDQMLDEDGAQRVVLSWDQFPGLPDDAARGALYPSAGERMRSFAQLLPGAESEFHLAVCNPAVFLPAVMARAGAATLSAFTAGADPRGLRWSEMVADLRAENPEVPVTVWCDEDAPLLWPDILAALVGHAGALPAADRAARAAELLTAEGAAALAAALSAGAGAEGPAAFRALLADHLARFARPGALEVTVEAEGLDAALAAELTAAYDADLARIAALPGVRLLRP